MVPYHPCDCLELCRFPAFEVRSLAIDHVAGDDLTFDSLGGLWSMGADAFFLCCHFATLAQLMYVAGLSPLCTTTECF